MADKKISAFSTITTIPGGPITVSDVLGIAGYCDDPAAPGTDVNVSFSGAEIVAAGLQDLDSVLTAGNAANNDIELNDGGANITFYKRNELDIQNQQPYEIKVRGSYYVNSTATAVTGSVIHLSSYNGGHNGHITINSRSTTNGTLQLITATELQINLPVAPTGAGDVLSAKNVSGDVEWVTPPPQSHQINGLAVNVGSYVTGSTNPRQVMFACSMASALMNQGPCMIVNNDFTVTRVQIKWIGRSVPVIPADALGQTADVNWELGKLTDPFDSSDTNRASLNYTSVLALPNLQCTEAVDTGTFIYKDSGPISASYTDGDILVLYYSAPTDSTMPWTFPTTSMTVAMTIEY